MFRKYRPEGTIAVGSCRAKFIAGARTKGGNSALAIVLIETRLWPFRIFRERWSVLRSVTTIPVL